MAIAKANEHECNERRRRWLIAAWKEWEYCSFIGREAFRLATEMKFSNEQWGDAQHIWQELGLIKKRRRARPEIIKRGRAAWRILEQQINDGYYTVGCKIKPIPKTISTDFVNIKGPR